MALLDRLKERVDTDLSDTELNALLAAAEKAVQQRFGVAGTTTFYWSRDYGDAAEAIVPNLPIDVAETYTVTEDETVLVAGTDFRVESSGAVLRRLHSGLSFPTHGPVWGYEVSIAYTPRSMTETRDEVKLKWCALSIQYQGVASASVGDSSATQLSFVEEEAKLFRSLDPFHGLGMA